MEEEEEIRSHTSGESDPSSSPAAGRITVTVASTGPPSYSLTPPSNPDALALALLPIHSSGGGGGSSNGRASGGGGREDCWSEGATGVLIDAWGERYLELSRGNLKQKHWKEVAEIVSSREDYTKTPKTDIQCKNRIDTVKKKYKQEKVRVVNDGARSRWVFYDKLDRLIGSTARIPSGGGGVNTRIPMGIPVSNRSSLYQQQQANNNVPMGIPMRMVAPQQQQGRMMVKRCSESKQWGFRKRNRSGSDSESEGGMSDDSGDSLPPPPPLSKRMKTEEKKKGNGDGGGSKWRELSRAIMRFGEAYEETENAKLQQVVELEKERIKFLKELELQRMQFFVKTQMEISQLSQRGRRSGNSSNNDHPSYKNNKMNSIVDNNDVGN